MGLIALSLVCSTAVAQAELGPEDPLPDIQVRRSIAKQWASWFAALDRQIPTLSPFENYTLQAKSVLSRIVIPHLEGRLP